MKKDLISRIKVLNLQLLLFFICKKSSECETNIHMVCYGKNLNVGLSWRL